MKSYSVKCFGTGDGAPCADRNHASFLYRFGPASILIDCGESIDSSYRRARLDYNLIDAILISHLHSDHFGGFFMLMQGCWLEQRRKPLPVYVPTGAIKPMQAMLKAAFLFDEVLPFRLRWFGLNRRRTVQLKEVRIAPFLTSHLDQTRRQFASRYRSDFSAYSFLIEHGRKRIAHSADLGRPEDLEPLLRQPLDLLVCELSHFSPEAVFRYLNGRKIKKVVFVHLRGEYHEQLPHVRRLGSKLLDLPHLFARDSEEIAF